MTSISAVSQKEQPTLTTSEQKQSASIFNNPRAMESTHQTVAESQITTEQNTNKVTWEWIKEFIDLILHDHEKYGLTQDDVLFTLSKFGYTAEKMCTMTKDDLTVIFSNQIIGILEYIYEEPSKANERLERVYKLCDIGNSLEETANHICEYGDKSLVDILKVKIAKNKNVSLPNEIKTKLLNMNSLADLTQDEITLCINTLVRLSYEDENKDININQLLLNFIYLNTSDKELKEDKVCDKLYNALSSNVSFDGQSKMFIAVMDKLKNSTTDIKIFLDNNKNIEKIFEKCDDPAAMKDLLINAQKIINSGDNEAKTELANKVGEYIGKIYQQVEEIKQKSPSTRTDIEEQILHTYELMKEIYATAGGFVNNAADDKHVQANITLTPEELISATYKNTHEISLSGIVKDPVKIKERMDRLTNNVYSEIIQSMGYELVTPDNVEELMAKAAEGKLIPENAPTSSSENTIGYEHSSTVNIYDAVANAGVLFSSIVNNTDEQTGFTVENVNKTSENVQEQATLFNKTNLSNYSGSELSDLISNGFMKFSDAVKQYTTHLSDSGKRFVVQSIKVMDDGRQTFALNSTSNTARWEIMKKADLLDENLNVDFDFNHEKLREKYQA